MTIAAVVLNYNRAADTIRCATSVLASRGATDVQVVIVDNGSTDSSAAVLKEWVAERQLSTSVRPLLVVNDSNGGYAAGNNTGIAAAYEQGAEYIWILNNDTTVAPDALELLLSAADKMPSAGVIGCTVADMQPPHKIQYVGGGRFRKLTTRQYYRGQGQPLGKRWSVDGPVEYIGGASLFCRATALLATGGFSTMYFLFYEELDLARRLVLRGWRLGVEPGAVVYHSGGATTESWSGRAKGDIPAFHATRSCIVFLRRWHPLALPTGIVVRVAYAASVALRKPSLTRSVLSGIGSGVSASLEEKSNGA